MWLTLIGDLHGMSAVHERVMDNHRHTLQLGDCGFNYAYMGSRDPERHKILGGNHDNYPLLTKLPHYLGDFGMWQRVFFVRGAWSIDRLMRVSGKDWWPEEEIEATLLADVITMYYFNKPDIVVSHDGPMQATSHLKGMFGSRRYLNRTALLLSTLLEIHQPKEWYFGHWHQSNTFAVPGCATTFRCLNEAETITIEVEDP